MKIALVYDRVNKFGGAERVLLALHEIWSDAPLYTAVYDPKGAPWAKDFDVRPSFLQYIPFARTHHEFFPWLTPLAFESFSFDGFDVVISITSAEAKGIITKPETLHICYCLTPTRYLWSGYEEYVKNPGLGKLGRVGRSILTYIAPTLRRWDHIGAARPDRYIAISDQVKDRIKQYYHRQVDGVIYPPVDLDAFNITKDNHTEEYFLSVSRLVGYKRVDILIDAFNELGLPLKIIGRGSAQSELRKRARKNIEFIDRHLTDEELNRYYQKCRAFVFAGQEDFGLVAAEAQAAGKPVICYKESGMAEIVVDGKTGILFADQSVESLIAGINRFFSFSFDARMCRENAERFDTEVFGKAIKAFVKKKL